MGFKVHCFGFLNLTKLRYLKLKPEKTQGAVNNNNQPFLLEDC